MEKFVYYTKLFDCYKNLLKEKEKLTFSYYYEENLSMQEIALLKGISKSAICSTIKNVELKLTNFEHALHLEAKQTELKKIMNTIKDEKIKEDLKKILK